MILFERSDINQETSSQNGARGLFPDNMEMHFPCMFKFEEARQKLF